MNYHFTNALFGYSASAHRLDLVAQQVSAMAAAWANPLNNRPVIMTIEAELFIGMMLCDIGNKLPFHLALHAGCAYYWYNLMITV